MKIHISTTNSMQASTERITLLLPPFDPATPDFKKIFEYVTKCRGIEQANFLIPSKGLLRIENCSSRTKVESVAEIELSRESEDLLRILISNVSIGGFKDSFSKFGMCDGGDFQLSIDTYDSEISMYFATGVGSGSHAVALSEFLEELDRLRGRDNSSDWQTEVK